MDPMNDILNYSEYHEKISPDDYHRVCRFCLLSEQNIKVYSVDELTASKIPSLYKELTDLELTTTLEHPGMVCESCYTQLENAVQSRQHFKNIEIFWNGYLANVILPLEVLKTEPMETSNNPSNYDTAKPLITLSSIRTIDDYVTLPDPMKNPEKYMNDYNQSIGSTCITEVLLKDFVVDHLEDENNTTGNVSASDDATGSNELEFIANEVSLHPVVLSKCQKPKIKKKKDAAIVQIINNYEHNFGIEINAVKFMRKLSTMKARLNRKLNINKNRKKDKKPLKLMEHEKLLLEVMEGGYDVGVKRITETSSKNLGESLRKASSVEMKFDDNPIVIDVPVTLPSSPPVTLPPPPPVNLLPSPPIILPPPPPVILPPSPPIILPPSPPVTLPLPPPVILPPSPPIILPPSLPVTLPPPSSVTVQSPPPVSLSPSPSITLLSPPPATLPPPPHFFQAKLEKYETNETKGLTDTELQRLVLLEQLHTIRLQRQYFKRKLELMKYK